MGRVGIFVRLVVIVAVLIVVTALLRARRWREGQYERVRAWAEGNGWSYLDDVTDVPLPCLSAPFRANGSAHCVVRGFWPRKGTELESSPLVFQCGLLQFVAPAYGRFTLQRFPWVMCSLSPGEVVAWESLFAHAGNASGNGGERHACRQLGFRRELSSLKPVQFLDGGDDLVKEKVERLGLFEVLAGPVAMKLFVSGNIAGLVTTEPVIESRASVRFLSTVLGRKANGEISEYTDFQDEQIAKLVCIVDLLRQKEC